MVNMYIFKQGPVYYCYPIPKDGTPLQRTRFVSVTSETYITQYRRTLESAGQRDVTIMNGLAPEHHQPRDGIEEIVCPVIRNGIGINPSSNEDNTSR